MWKYIILLFMPLAVIVGSIDFLLFCEEGLLAYYLGIGRNGGRKRREGCISWFCYFDLKCRGNMIWCLC